MRCLQGHRIERGLALKKQVWGLAVASGLSTLRRDGGVLTIWGRSGVVSRAGDATEVMANTEVGRGKGCLSQQGCWGNPITAAQRG